MFNKGSLGKKRQAMIEDMQSIKLAFKLKQAKLE